MVQKSGKSVTGWGQFALLSNHGELFKISTALFITEELSINFTYAPIHGNDTSTLHVEKIVVKVHQVEWTFDNKTFGKATVEHGNLGVVQEKKIPLYHFPNRQKSTTSFKQVSFQYDFWMFTPYLGERFPFWGTYFSNRLLQPPPSSPYTEA